jgi:hypothetical protein
MPVFLVAAIILAIPVALLLTRLGPRILGFHGLWSQHRRPGRELDRPADRMGQVSAMTRIAERFGYGIALRVSIDLEGEDFTSRILKAKAANVDAILFLGNVPGP